MSDQTNGSAPADQPSEPITNSRGTDPLRASQISRLWVGVTALVVMLLLLVIFVAQNTQRVEVSFLGWNGHPPLSVAILAAVVVGLALAVIAGTLRLLELRRRVRRTS